MAAFIWLLTAAGCTPDTPIAMRHDVLAALEEGALGHKAVLLVYAASWCGACRALSGVLESPQMAGALRRMVVVRIELGDDLRPVQRVPPALNPEVLGIRAVPTLVYLPHLPTLTPEPGAIVQGYVGRKRLTEWLESRS